MHLRIPALVAAALAAVVVTAVVLAVVQLGPSEPKGSAAQLTAQSGSADQNGVRLELVDATFSGTETMVRIRVSVDGSAPDGVLIPPDALAPGRSFQSGAALIAEGLARSASSEASAARVAGASQPTSPGWATARRSAPSTT